MDSRQHLVDVPHRVGERWALVRREADTAAEQMAIDERLAAQAQRTVRLFRWRRPAVSLGRRQSVPSWVKESSLAAHGIELVERPTGGGIALHGSDLSFSVVAPFSPGGGIDALMEMIASLLGRALRTMGVWMEWSAEADSATRMTYCLTERSPYALMVGTRKLGGMAIRRTRASWLIQGSLLLRALPPIFDMVMPAEVRLAFETCAITVEEACGHDIDDADVENGLLNAFRFSVLPFDF